MMPKTTDIHHDNSVHSEPDLPLAHNGEYNLWFSCGCEQVELMQSSYQSNMTSKPII